jgi:hypothetical protein
MSRRKIILLSAIFFAAAFAACDMLAQTYETTGPIFVAPPSEDCSSSQPVFVEAPAGDCSSSQSFVEQPSSDCSSSQPIYIAPPGQMMVQPGVPMGAVPMEAMPQGIPGAPMVYPPGVYAPTDAGVPMPGAVPMGQGPAPGPFSGIASNGALSPKFGLPAGPEAPMGPNSIQVPVANDEAAWDQIVDVVTEYFPVAREQQARRSGAAWAEGRIETGYQSVATIFEPFRKDSVGSYNRWESTFQTIRRIAVVRVMPDAVGFQVEVIVQKELEDLPRPENSTAGSAVFRNVTTLPSSREPEVNRLLSSPRWIPLGRDPALEAKMAADIQARFTAPPDSSWPTFW